MPRWLSLLVGCLAACALTVQGWHNGGDQEQQPPKFDSRGTVNLPLAYHSSGTSSDSRRPRSLEGREA